MKLSKLMAPALLRIALLSSCTAFAAHGAAVITQNFDQGGNNFDITGLVMADDFTLGSATSLTNLSMWLADRAQTNVLDGIANNFSGTLGWAIYSNVGNLPGTILFSGSDAAASVTSTGLLSPLSGREIFQVNATLSGAPFLAAGTYWLALRDGAWGSASDGTIVGWQASGTANGRPHAFSNSLTIPSFAGDVNDLAFVLSDAPEPSTLVLSGLGVVGLALLRRRKN